MQNHIITEHLNNGNSTYFIDVEKTVNDGLFVMITESKKTEQGYVKHKIMILEDQIDDLISSLNEVNQKLKIASKSNENKTYSFQKPIINYTIIDDNWTKEEDSALVLLYRKGKTIAELAMLFNRNEEELTSRIKELQLKLGS